MNIGIIMSSLWEIIDLILLIPRFNGAIHIITYTSVSTIFLTQHPFPSTPSSQIESPQPLCVRVVSKYIEYITLSSSDDFFNGESGIDFVPASRRDDA